MPPVRTNVYIDGFNLYYRLVKGTPYKWLDLRALSEAILKPYHDIQTISYFTANVSAFGDPQRPIRQNTYIRALKSHIPAFNDHYGHFLTNTKEAIIADPPPPPYRKIKILDTKEKGSDVKLAVHLLNDAWLDRYDCALIISNDSDLLEAIQLAQARGKRIGVAIPGTKNPSSELLRIADFKKIIRPSVLPHCQLPDPIPGTTIHKPSSY